MALPDAAHVDGNGGLWWIAMALSSAATNARRSSLLLAGFLYSPDEEYP